MSATPLHILFICAMNRQRSVTAERLYQDDPRLHVRSAGVRHEATRRVCEADLMWADVVYVMELDHKLWVSMRFDVLDLPPIVVLDIPDEYRLMEPALQEILRSRLGPEIERLLAR